MIEAIIKGIFDVINNAIKTGGPQTVLSILGYLLGIVALLVAAYIVKEIFANIKENKKKSENSTIIEMLNSIISEMKLNNARLSGMISEALRNSSEGFLRPDHTNTILDVLFLAYTYDFINIVDSLTHEIKDKKLTPVERKKYIEYLKDKFGSVLASTDDDIATLPDVGTALADTPLKLKFLEDKRIYDFILDTIQENPSDYKSIKEKVSTKINGIMVSDWKLRH